MKAIDRVVITAVDSALPCEIADLKPMAGIEALPLFSHGCELLCPNQIK
jgi:hypothetical protein